MAIPQLEVKGKMGKDQVERDERGGGANTQTPSPVKGWKIRATERLNEEGEEKVKKALRFELSRSQTGKHKHTTTEEPTNKKKKKKTNTPQQHTTKKTGHPQFFHYRRYSDKPAKERFSLETPTRGTKQPKQEDGPEGNYESTRVTILVSRQKRKKAGGCEKRGGTLVMGRPARGTVFATLFTEGEKERNEG